MYVLKRNGKREEVSFDKITSRIKKLCYGLNDKFVDPVSVLVWCGTLHRCFRSQLQSKKTRAPTSSTQIIITQKVIQGVYPGVTTVELDELAAETGM